MEMGPRSQKLFLLVLLAAAARSAGAAGDAGSGNASADASPADGSSPSPSPSSPSSSPGSPVSSSTVNGSSSPASVDSSPADASQPCVESVTPAGLRLTHLTAFASCQQQGGAAFQVALVRFAGAAGSADTTAVSGPDSQFLLSGPVNHRWLGPGFTVVEPKWIDVYVAVLRLSDGQLVAPKTVVPSAANPAVVERLDAIEDVRKACLLLEQQPDAGGDGSSGTRFAQFRLRLSVDGTRVLGSDDTPQQQGGGGGASPSPSPAPDAAAAAAPAAGNSSQPGEQAGTPCEQFTAAGATGRLVDVYRPGGCWFGVDACG